MTTPPPPPAVAPAPVQAEPTRMQPGLRTMPYSPGAAVHAPAPVQHLEPGALLDLLADGPVTISESAWAGDKIVINRRTAGGVFINVAAENPWTHGEFILASGEGGILARVWSQRGRSWGHYPISAGRLAELRKTRPAFAYAYDVAVLAQARWDNARRVP